MRKGKRQRKAKTESVSGLAEEQKAEVSRARQKRLSNRDLLDSYIPPKRWMELRRIAAAIAKAERARSVKQLIAAGVTRDQAEKLLNGASKRLGRTGRRERGRRLPK
jgi:hypothetical protein